mgnify:CR=1 FL=1
MATDGCGVPLDANVSNRPPLYWDLITMSDWQKAEEHVERAGEMVRTGKWKDAERELRRATEIDPNRGEWHALLGSSLDALGRPEEALASIRQAAALMPEELDPLLVAAEISQRLERWEDALEFTERAMDLDNEDDLIHALKISSLAAMSRNEDAEVAYFIAQQSLDMMPRCLIAMGDLQLSQQNLEQADWCYQEAMRQDSSIPRLRTRLASLFAMMGKPQRAFQLHMAELRENPASIDTLLECGSLLITMHRPLEAIEKFRRVLEVEPAHVEAHWRIAQASLDMENFDQALQIINNHEFGNGTSIYTSNGGFARNFMKNVQIGMVGINVPIPVPMAFYSFGGWKGSIFGGHGMHGEEGINFYTKRKTITSRWPDDVASASLNMPTMK